MLLGDQHATPCMIIRGGTSRGVYFLEDDLPPQGTTRDQLLKRVMASADAQELDGLGGGSTNTSKIAIIAPSQRKDADINYEFIQVGIGTDSLNRTGTCGNLIVGAGVFALAQGLVVPNNSNATIIRIYDVNANSIITAEIPLCDGIAATTGKFKIEGIPYTGSEITLDFTSTIGSHTKRLLPTKQVVEPIQLRDGRTYPVTIADAGNPAVFIEASALSLPLLTTATEATPYFQKLGYIDQIRGIAAQRMGMIKDPDTINAHYGYIPFFSVVSQPTDTDTHDIFVQTFFDGKTYRSFPSTGMLCLAACACIKGSIVQKITGDAVLSGKLRIGTYLGIRQIEVDVDKISEQPKIQALRMSSSARIILQGQAFAP